jgi:thioesterase domain-containing protein
VDGKVAQLIMPVQPLNLPVLDLTGVPEDAREATMKEGVREDARRPFDLTRGPMLRTGLLRLGAEDHVLLLTTHHIVCDYWSTRILIRELFTLYGAFTAGQDSPLPELGFQYSDFVRWFETRLQDKGPELLTFWKARLAGKDFHHLEPAHPPPIPRSYRGAHEQAIFPEELSNSIKLLGVRERLSPFMIMLAGLQCLVQRYSGQGDIGIGSCVANRPLPQLEDLIGPFANVSVLRTDLAGNPGFKEIFRRVREECLDAFNYQDMPFGTLVDTFQPSFDPTRHPIFQILFVFLNAPSEPWEVPGLTVDPIAVDAGTSCFELNMNVRMHDRLQIDVEYSSDLFEADTIREFLEDYRAVLETICTNPEVGVGALAIKKRQAGIGGQQQLRDPALEYVPPKDAIESQMVELWEPVLGKRPIGVNDNFFELGGDSLRAARLFARIAQTFGRSVPVSTLVRAPTIATLAKAIFDASMSDTGVVALQSGGASPPLFCLPGQTGSVLIFRGLAQHLGSDQPVYGLQPQGLYDSHPPLTRVEDMAANFIRQIQGVQPKGPYFFLGYCMGGTIALEMAQQLYRQGQTVGLLALVDTYNWDLLKHTSSTDNFYFRIQQWWFSWQRGGLRWKELRERKSPLSFLMAALPGREKSLRRFSEFWSTPAAERVSECNLQAALSYAPQAYPGRILHISPARQLARYKRPELSLNSMATDGVEEFLISGYPAQLFEEPLVRNLAAKVRDSIDRVAGRSSPAPTAPTRA